MSVRVTATAHPRSVLDPVRLRAPAPHL
jgi:hypothetical protein